MKGGCVVIGRGVVHILTAVEEDLGMRPDVAVAGGKVEQRIIKFPKIFRSFGVFWKNFSEYLRRNLSQGKVKVSLIS